MEPSSNPPYRAPWKVADGLGQEVELKVHKITSCDDGQHVPQPLTSSFLRMEKSDKA